MNFPTFFESKKTKNLFGLSDTFEFLKKLYMNNKLPKVLMLSGKKGSGKSTLVNHLMFFIFDEKNYNVNNNELVKVSTFFNLFINDIFSNIIYLSGSNFKGSKIEDIRNLKNKIFQTTISDKPRFIIFDDVELFNNNSLNALLKIIEEPSEKNFFFLINNKTRPLLETIKSRCLDINIIINEIKRISIIESLKIKFNIDFTLDPINSKLSPGQFIKFDHILYKNNITLDSDFQKNLAILLNLYKKNKEVIFIDLVLFLTDSYFNGLRKQSRLTNDKIVEYKRFTFDNINKFFLYNLNQNALLSTIHNKINEE
ncbi:AAA family ATPase [Candidatus Pelagibacter bacterium]|nr:AAA family ATPase [Candidatus Pelagibacter bacterium]